MQAHLEEISTLVAPGAHAIVLLDQAGWHTSGHLRVADKVTLLPLPPRSPELNRVKNVWQFMCDNWLSNRVFAGYDDILAHCCDSSNKLVDQPWHITTIGLRNWAMSSTHRMLVLARDGVWSGKVFIQKPQTELSLRLRQQHFESG